MAYIWTRWALRSHPVGWCHQERKGFPLVIALLPLPSTILQTQLGLPVCTALHDIRNQKDGNCKACLIGAGGRMVIWWDLIVGPLSLKGLVFASLTCLFPCCDILQVLRGDIAFLSCYAGVWRPKRFCACLQKQRLCMPACLQSYNSRAFCADFVRIVSFSAASSYDNI